MRILGMPADSTGCGHYRINLPLAQLKRMGHGAGIIRPGQPCDFRDTYDPATLDIIVGQRVSGEGISMEWQRLSAVKGRNYRLVYEIDDDLWNIDRSNKPAWNYYMEDQARRDRMIANVRAADLVTVTTECLADVISVWNQNVTVLPNYIDEAVFGVRRKRPGWFTVGCGGSVSHTGDWEYAGKSIGRFFTANPGTAMHFIGAEFCAQLPPAAARQIFLTPWINSVPDYYASLVMDVGIAPLRPTFFNQSKSNLKALEYAALGIPCVAAHYAPYEDFVQHGTTGFLAKRDDWARCLKLLYHEPEMRSAMAQAGIELAHKHTIQANAWRWIEAYESIL
jgi:glycosyltransferase involved in cell wall biosynthesis